MVAINFSAEFARAVEDRDKRQTIRKAARCKPDDLLQLYTGMRTKNCRLLGVAVCVNVTPVVIGRFDMTLDGRAVRPGRDSAIARADGFRHFLDMSMWFRKKYGLPFSGQLIKWEFRP